MSNSWAEASVSDLIDLRGKRAVVTGAAMGFFAERLSRVAPSATIAMGTRALQMKAAGRNVIGLAQGEPDFDTPAHIIEAAHAAMKRGETRYTAVDGTPALKQAVADKFRREIDRWTAVVKRAGVKAEE